MFYLTFLGTSAGVPTKQRNVSALAVVCFDPYAHHAKRKAAQKHRPWVLIDCGEGTQHQLLRSKLSLLDLQAICITHVHGDHCYGLPGLLASMAMAGRSEPLTLIAPKAIGTLLDTLRQATELFLPYPVTFLAIEDLLTNSAAPHHRLNFTEQHHLDISITPLSHRVASFAFALTQHTDHQKLDTAKLEHAGIARGVIWGQLFKGLDVHTETGEQLRAADYIKVETHSLHIVVAGDNDDADLLLPLIDNASLLVHEATYTQDVHERIQARIDSGQQLDPKHSTAAQVAAFAQKIQLPNLILTHFSARYQLFEDIAHKTANMAHIRAEAEAQYHGNLWLAEDFAQFEISHDGEVKRTDIS
ncbi:ribonuclease Z [Cardiobacteriaceae bacterium TAE3-ERU3]|nr:ribonuclease Z [Cardiobacteriaceae bacterium TAE3-ERU3]